MANAFQTGRVNHVESGQPPDNGVPPGECPPRPKWILVLAVAAWCAWFVFLVAMMVYRFNTAGR